MRHRRNAVRHFSLVKNTTLCGIVYLGMCRFCGFKMHGVFMERIKQDIKTGQFNRLYLLYGDDDYFRTFYKNKLKEALISEDDMNLTEFSGKDVDVNAIMDTARTIPFLSERRVVIVSDTGLLNPKSKKGDSDGDDDLEDSESENQKEPEKKKQEYGLAEFLAEIPDTTVLIFNEEKINRGTKLYKACAKYGYAASFEKIKENDPQGIKKLQGYVLAKLKRENKNITYGAMNMFLDRTGTDLQKVFLELDKLLSYTMGRDSITEDDVRVLIPERLEDKIFEMIDCISSRKQKRALDLYYDLIRKKEAPVKILSLIERHYHQVYVIKKLSSTGMDYKDILKMAEIKSSSDYVYKKYLGLARQYSDEDLKKAMEMCLDFDKSFKSGKIKDNVAVEMVIVAMSSRGE